MAAPRTSHALATYARGVARAATGDRSGAESALVEVRKLHDEARAENPSHVTTPVVEIAVHALAGEIARREDRVDEAIEHFEKAGVIEDELQYEEPPLWLFPIRHQLGAMLLEAGRAAEAEAIYREDLARFPDNGWSLIGLLQSLGAQGKDAEAREVRERLGRAWARADIQLEASSF